MCYVSGEWKWEIIANIKTSGWMFLQMFSPVFYLKWLTQRLISKGPKWCSSWESKAFVKAGPKYFKRHILFFAKKMQLLVILFLLPILNWDWMLTCPVFSVNKHDLLGHPSPALTCSHQYTLGLCISFCCKGDSNNSVCTESLLATS